MKQGSDDCGPHLTIVGGQPRELPRRRPFSSKVPVGIEVVLHKAAREPDFRALLLGDRDAGLRASGVRLTETELAALRAAPPAVLVAMIEGLEDPARPPSRLLGFVAAAAASLAAGTATVGCGGTISAGVTGSAEAGVDAGADVDAHFPNAAVVRTMDAGADVDAHFPNAAVVRTMDAGADVDAHFPNAAVVRAMDAGADVDAGFPSAGARVWDAGTPPPSDASKD